MSNEMRQTKAEAVVRYFVGWHATHAVGDSMRSLYLESAPVFAGSWTRASFWCGLWQVEQVMRPLGTSGKTTFIACSDFFMAERVLFDGLTRKW